MDDAREEMLQYLHRLDVEGYNILADAAEEYRNEGDGAVGWASMAEFLEMSEAQVLCVFLLKHVRSICRDLSIREDMTGRIVDAMNYLRLIAWTRKVNNDEKAPINHSGGDWYDRMHCNGSESPETYSTIAVSCRHSGHED